MSTEPDDEPLKCPNPKCGATLFRIQELIYSEHFYDSDTEEWGEYKDFAEDAPCVGVVCDECDRDCSALFAAAGWVIRNEATMKERVFTEIDFQI